jgi:hypothetical protein
MNNSRIGMTPDEIQAAKMAVQNTEAVMSRTTSVSEVMAPPGLWSSQFRAELARTASEFAAEVEYIRQQVTHLDVTIRDAAREMELTEASFEEDLGTLNGYLGGSSTADKNS